MCSRAVCRGRLVPIPACPSSLGDVARGGPAGGTCAVVWEADTIAGRGTGEKSGNLAGLGCGENTTAGGAAWAYGDAAESLCWPAGNEGGLRWIAALGHRAPSPKQVVGRRGKVACHRPQTYLFVLTKLAVCVLTMGPLSFNRPQTYLFVLTQLTAKHRNPGDIVSIVLRRISSYSQEDEFLTWRPGTQFQSSSDVSLRTHRRIATVPSPPPHRFNRPQTYLFVLTCPLKPIKGRFCKFQSSSDVSLRTHGGQHYRGDVVETPVSIVLRRISSYSHSS